MASKQKRAQSAQNDDGRSQEVYTCTNEEVLSALFIGINVRDIDSSSQPGKTQDAFSASAAPTDLPMIANDLDDDTSAEEDDDLIRAHSRIMRQQEYEQRQREGYVEKHDSSQLNQLDNSSRHNLVESGSLQMQSSQNSPQKTSQMLDTSPSRLTQQHQQLPIGIQQNPLQVSQTIQKTSSQGQLDPTGSFFKSSVQEGIGNLMVLSDSKQYGQITTPQMMSSPTYEHGQAMGTLGNMSNRQHRRNSKGRRGRPISAYPVPGSYPGHLSHINESIESTQASHLTRFTRSLAHNQASRKHYVPSHVENLEKERLYTETISLKKQRNDAMQQNTMLKTNLKVSEGDLRKKDQIIAQLTNEIKIGAQQQSMGFYQPNFNGMPNTNSFVQTPPELMAIGTYSGSRQQKQMQQQMKVQQLVKQNADFRKRIKELKCDTAVKETEIQNLQRTLKFTKLKEFEAELHTYSNEIIRLRNMLMSEKAKPRVDPAQYAALQNQLIIERQQMQLLAQQNEQQRQDIEKLTQAHGSSKQKLQRSKAKCKKMVLTKKRQETKVKFLEQKVSDVSKQATKINTSSLKGTRGSRSKQTSKVNASGGVTMQEDNETQDQLQTQLEINQILIDKLDSMGVDVRELIRTSQMMNPEDPPEPDIHMVIFTFVGPEGLIEGGDNQQFEMPIDFSQVTQVEEIKEILKRELVMDMGIDLVLHEKQSGQLLEQIQDVHIAINSGDGILVQFIENEGGDNQNRFGVNMPNINERDEQSEYSDEAFEEEDGQDEEQPEEEGVKVARVTRANIANGLKHIRLLFMIKKVPKTHMVAYLLRGEKLQRSDDTGEETISTKSLAQIFERKFNFDGKKATKVARFFVEGPSQGENDAMIVAKDHIADREALILRFKMFLGEYIIYNTLAFDSMLDRLQGIMSGKGQDFLDDLNLEDEDSNSYLPFEQIRKVWKYSGHPELDEELTEFLEFLALRCSISLKSVSYEELCDVFEDGFTLGADCQHDDETPFDVAEVDPDDQALEEIRLNRDTAANTAAKDELPLEGSSMQQHSGEENEPEIDSDDLMLYIDQALFKLVAQLPGENKKTNLNKKLLPLASSTFDDQTNETLLILQPQVFIQFMVQTLGVQFSDKELYCLLHILVRETSSSNQSENLSPGDGLNQTQDNQGYILYRDVYTLVRNYLRKEKIMGQSIRYGLEYQVLTKVTFDFLLRIKQVLNGTEEKPQLDSSTKSEQRMTNDQEHEIKNFREVFGKHIQIKRVTEVNVDLIEFDDFFDTLFMKFKIMCPPKDTMEQLRVLLCVQFGPNIKEPSFFLVKKIERVLYDLDYVYVNLVKILREPNHEKLQTKASQRLKQRYDFVARGISKTTIAAKPSATQAAYQDTKGQAKPRPMSSKPRNQPQQKQQQSSSMEKNSGGIDEEDDIDDAIMDEYEEKVETRGKQQYKHQKTNDIGFEMPLDDDEDDDDEDLDEGIFDEEDLNDEEVDDDDPDYEDDIGDSIEDEEAAVMSKGKKKTARDSSDYEIDDAIDDEYSDDGDSNSPPANNAPKAHGLLAQKETKTLNNKETKKQQRDEMEDYEESDDGFVEEDIIDDNYSI